MHAECGRLEFRHPDPSCRQFDDDYNANATLRAGQIFVAAASALAPAGQRAS